MLADKQRATKKSHTKIIVTYLKYITYDKINCIQISRNAALHEK